MAQSPLLETRSDLLKKTKAFWEPRYGRRLSDEEAREIVENVVGFLRILEEWESRRDDPEGTSDTPAPPPDR